MQRNVCRDNVTWALCSRLYELYDPFIQLHIDSWEDPADYMRIRQYEPIYGYRDTVYHYGRINYFMNQLRQKKKIHPISVFDNTSVLYPNDFKVLIEDGHHRFAAHIKCGKRTVWIEYTGEPGLLAYLQGKVNKFTK